MNPAICFLSLLLVVPLADAQTPRGQRTATVVLAGPALSSGAAQEAFVLAVSWVEFADQVYPRQNVQIVMDYWWGGGKTTRIVDDARTRRPDYDRAKVLLSNAGYLSRGTTLVLMTDHRNPDLMRATNWLRDQLQRQRIAVAPNVLDASRTNLESEKAPAILWIRTP